MAVVIDGGGHGEFVFVQRFHEREFLARGKSGEVEPGGGGTALQRTNKKQQQKETNFA